MRSVTRLVERSSNGCVPGTGHLNFAGIGHFYFAATEHCPGFLEMTGGWLLRNVRPAALDIARIGA
jgi:hypothetical protein